MNGTDLIFVTAASLMAILGILTCVRSFWLNREGEKAWADTVFNQGFLMLVFAFLLASSLAKALELSETPHRVSFVANVDSILIPDVEGECERCLSGTIETKGGVLSGEATLDLEKLLTGNRLRDKHMREAVVSKSATMRFDSRKACFGELQLRAKTGGVTFTTCEVDARGVLATFRVPLSQYGIGPVKKMGTTVQDLVEVRVEVGR